MWEDICRTNADEITFALDEFISELDAARSGIESGDFESLRDAFEDANELVRRVVSRGDR
jgi:prephenate dehydrogenase